jgi:hypothetical protein
LNLFSFLVIVGLDPTIQKISDSLKVLFFAKLIAIVFWEVNVSRNLYGSGNRRAGMKHISSSKFEFV